MEVKPLPGAPIRFAKSKNEKLQIFQRGRQARQLPVKEFHVGALPTAGAN
jgi:hypothetical protein